MKNKDYASWKRAQRHMGRSGECLGTVQMSCRYTGGSMGGGVVLAGKLVEGHCLGRWGLKSDPDSPAPKPTKPAREPKSTAPKAPPRSLVSIPVTYAQPAPTSTPAKPQEKKRKQTTKTYDKPSKAKKYKYGFVGKKRTLKSVAESVAEDAPTKEPHVAAEDADMHKALEESLKSMFDVPRVRSYQWSSGNLSQGNINRSQRCQERAKQRHDEPSYAELGQPKSKEESKKVVLGADEGGQGEGQVGPDPGAQAKGQTGPDAGT
uniref:Uncharacterized protein n=1 Tax=Tanacetum cinerariifolium TaxID=118510 RepID=A0A699J7L4_TANCI|nr:hypothetical protein [Tanacetum cinerariifolium]